MKRFVWILCVGLALALLCAGALAEGREAVLLFTHDLHSHMGEDRSDAGGVGGMARIATLIAAERAAAGDTPVLVLDAGDFSMGTLYQAIFSTHAAELTLLGRLGYDATTFGNHEFDYGEAALAKMLRAAKDGAAADESLTLPLVLSSNIDWEKSDDAEAAELRAAFDAYGGAETALIERGGVRVGLFAIMGGDSQSDTPTSDLAYKDTIASAQSAVRKLQSEGAELIVCLSHSGTWRDLAHSEDEQLALKVPAIDVIVSGHTHSRMTTPIRRGDTTIVSSGSYARDLGALKLRQTENGRWAPSDYRLLNADTAVAQDADTLAALAAFARLIDEECLAPFGYTLTQTLCQNDVDFTRDDAIRAATGESPLGDLLADSYRYAIARFEGENHVPVDVAVVPDGVVRASLAEGGVTVADAFNILSLGVGDDGLAGFPLVSIYLKAEDLRAVAEVDASVSNLMPAAKLAVSGMGWSFNPGRLFMNRALDVCVLGDGGERIALEEGRLYRVVTDMYTALMLETAKKKSFGLLSITALDQNGVPVTDFKQNIVTAADGSEVKAWQALAAYFSSFAETGISSAYAGTQGRVVRVNDASLGVLLRSPNKVFWLLVLVIVVLIALVTGIVLLVRGLVRRRRWHGGNGARGGGAGRGGKTGGASPDAAK